MGTTAFIKYPIFIRGILTLELRYKDYINRIILCYNFLPLSKHVFLNHLGPF